MANINSKNHTYMNEQLEEKKIAALERIANSLDALVDWFEEIDKDEWDARAQFYLAEFHKRFVNPNDE